MKQFLRKKKSPWVMTLRLNLLSKKSTTTTFQSIKKHLGMMEENDIGRAEIILNKILDSPTVSIEDPGGILHFEHEPFGLNLFCISHSSQQRTLIFRAIFYKISPNHLRFSTLNVIVNDKNEICSVDMAHVVDKLANYNRDIKYLLVVVDWLSRYLLGEPLKTMYATEDASVLINNKNI